MYGINLGNMAQYIRQFQTLKDWIEYAESPCALSDHQRASHDTARINFFESTNFLAAIKLFRQGWPEGREKLQSILDALQSRISLPSMVAEFEASVDGCAPHVEAFLQGMPENMFHLHEVEQDTSPTHLTVQIEMSANCYIEPSQILWAGSVVFATVQALRLQGCSTTLLLSHTVSDMARGGYSGNDEYQTIVTLPPNLDNDTAAFLFTHPSTLRRIVFSIREHETPDIIRQFGFCEGCGYGASSEMKNPHADIMLVIRNMAECFATRYTQEQNLHLAQLYINNLVDTKFKSYLK